MLADLLGYTVDFDVYSGAQHERAVSENGLAYDAVMELVQPFHYQGYQFVTISTPAQPSSTTYTKLEFQLLGHWDKPQRCSRSSEELESCSTYVVRVCAEEKAIISG